MELEPLHPIQAARLRAMTPEERGRFVARLGGASIPTGMRHASSRLWPRSSPVEEPDLNIAYLRNVIFAG
ncbi:MAG TPA: hypothetical protein VIM48_05560 [Chthoniobacterales bacterium]